MGVEVTTFLRGLGSPAEVGIADADRYTVEMAKSLIDKVYFLDKTDANLVVDYGCADGMMLAFIAKVFPGVRLVGFDNDAAMVSRAREAHAAAGIHFTSSWEDVADLIRANQDAGGQSCLVLSSVIHEVYSYTVPSEVDAFWRRVWGQDGVRFDYVAIRDMMVSRLTSRGSDPIAVARVRQVFDSAKIADWEARWGSLNENWSLVHFLLTYRYTHSWDREYRENYLPLNFEDLLSLIPREYFPVFQETFTLPFLRRRVREDFGFDLADRTHVKLVLEWRA